MNNKNTDDLNNQLILTDALLRITVIEKLLISKGIITKEEFTKEISELSSKITSALLKNVQESTKKIEN